jgi:hypothetical protein
MKTTKLVAVRLDDPRFGSGPATVVAYPSSVAEYNTLITDRDGARDRRMRLWQAHGDVPIGARVNASLICGTGLGELHETCDERGEP